MNAPRETIYAALFALAAGATVGGQPAFQVYSRHAVEPASAPAYPALYQKQDDETAKQPVYGLTRWQMRAFWLIYLKNDASPAAVNSTQINTYLDLVDGLVGGTPIGTKRQLVSGGVALCDNVWIDGKIVVDENPLGAVATILVPISIVTAD